MDLNDADTVARWLATDPPHYERDQFVDDLIGWHGHRKGLEIWSEAANLVERGQR